MKEHAPIRPCSRTGFTLVEILVTTAMFSLLAAAALSVFNAGTRSAATSRRYREMIAHGQTALDAMSADIRAAVAHSSGPPDTGGAAPGAAPGTASGAAPGTAAGAAPGTAAGTSAATAASAGIVTRLTSQEAEDEGRECDTLGFVIGRINPDYKDPDEGGHAAVAYYLNTDPASGPRGLLRRENRTTGDDFLTAGRVALVAPGVTQLKLEFYDGVAWAAGWSNDQDFPKAVRISIVVEDEAGLENSLFFTTTVSVMAQ